MSGAPKAKTPPRVWTCDGCGRAATWGPGWREITGVPSPSNAGYPMVVCSLDCEGPALDAFMASRRASG